MFLHYYGFRDQPFGVTPNPAYLYVSVMHREALASLIYSIETQLGFALLIGPPGTGKTTLLFALLERYRRSAHTALVLPCPGGDDVLRSIMVEFELDYYGTDAIGRRERFNGFLLKAARERKPVIVIVDEAQSLSDRVLENIRLLSNFETPQHKLLHIILAGQPLLAERLRSASLKQLLQRITIVGRLGVLSPMEVGDYIRHRLAIGGYTGAELFTHEAVNLVAEYSSGIPRSINAICFNALSLGFALQRKSIGADIVAEVVKDRDLRALVEVIAADVECAPSQISRPASARRYDVVDTSTANERLPGRAANRPTDVRQSGPEASLPADRSRSEAAEALFRTSSAPVEASFKASSSPKSAAKPEAVPGGNQTSWGARIVRCSVLLMIIASVPVTPRSTKSGSGTGFVAQPQLKAAIKDTARNDPVLEKPVARPSARADRFRTRRKNANKEVRPIWLVRSTVAERPAFFDDVAPPSLVMPWEQVLPPLLAVAPRRQAPLLRVYWSNSAPL